MIVENNTPKLIIDLELYFDILIYLARENNPKSLELVTKLKNQVTEAPVK